MVCDGVRGEERVPILMRMMMRRFVIGCFVIWGERLVRMVEMMLVMMGIPEPRRELFPVGGLYVDAFW